MPQTRIPNAPLFLLLLFVSFIGVYHILPTPSSSSSSSSFKFTTFTRDFLSSLKSPKCKMSSSPPPPSSSSSPSWSSPLSGFLERASPFPHPSSSFKPPRSALELAVLRNAPADPEGFTLAIFSSSSAFPQADSDSSSEKELTHNTSTYSSYYAVDAHGHISVLTPTDASGLLSLARESTRSLPPTGAFRNTWVLLQDRTSQPIERILTPKGVAATSRSESESGAGAGAGSALPDTPAADYRDEYDEVSVQGFDYHERRLKRAVEGREVLPETLWELTGVVLEGRRDGGGDGDEEVLAYVRQLLGNVF